ncbi:hypothetical protein BKA80DRAFT_869 [Phyllosticta citrichinensis]
MVMVMVMVMVWSGLLCSALLCSGHGFLATATLAPATSGSSHRYSPSQSFLPRLPHPHPHPHPHPLLSSPLIL